MTKFRKFAKQLGKPASSRQRKSVRTFRTTTFFFALGLLLLISASSSVGEDTNSSRQPANGTVNARAVLWVQPANIAGRDLFYGPGGKDDQPHTTFTFLREDFNGTNPKFDVRDESGTKWRVKIGIEAKPETAASRLLWAVGYFANEDYFLPELRVEDLKPLKRGRKMVSPDGTVENVRLKRSLTDEKKIGNWHWRSNPFFGTREFNGLRVMMALMNSWDLKDENNSIYEVTGSENNPRLLYMVSDLGGTFGTTGVSFPISDSKGNLPAYAKSKFIKKVSGEYVDFNVPTRPNFWRLVNVKQFIRRVRLEWIGRHVPRADARWMGQLLSQLSRDQVRQAFQAAGYSPDDANRFTDVVEERINELKSL
jgi:hypothetical protein